MRGVPDGAGEASGTVPAARKEGRQRWAKAGVEGSMRWSMGVDGEGVCVCRACVVVYLVARRVVMC